MIVIDYDNDLYRKHLKNWKQEEFTEKLKKTFVVRPRHTLMTNLVFLLYVVI